MHFLHQYRQQPVEQNTEDFLNSLRSIKGSKIALHNALRKNVQHINAALNDAAIFAALGGQEGVKKFAATDLDVCQAVLASDVYKTFDQNIKSGIQTLAQNLESDRYRYAPTSSSKKAPTPDTKQK